MRWKVQRANMWASHLATHGWQVLPLSRALRCSGLNNLTMVWYNLTMVWYNLTCSLGKSALMYKIMLTHLAHRCRVALLAHSFEYTHHW